MTERRPAGSVLGYRIQPLDRAGQPLEGPLAVELGPCAPLLGPSPGASVVAQLLALAAICLDFGLRLVSGGRSKTSGPSGVN